MSRSQKGTSTLARRGLTSSRSVTAYQEAQSRRRGKIARKGRKNGLEGRVRRALRRTFFSLGFTHLPSCRCFPCNFPPSFGFFLPPVPCFRWLVLRARVQPAVFFRASWRCSTLGIFAPSFFNSFFPPLFVLSIHSRFCLPFVYAFRPPASLPQPSTTSPLSMSHFPPQFKALHQDSSALRAPSQADWPCHPRAHSHKIFDAALLLLPSSQIMAHPFNDVSCSSLRRALPSHFSSPSPSCFGSLALPPHSRRPQQVKSSPMSSRSRAASIFLSAPFLHTPSSYFFHLVFHYLLSSSHRWRWPR